MSGSTAYSSASAYSAMTNSAEAFDYDDLQGIFVHFAKARFGAVSPAWGRQMVLERLQEVRRRLHSLAALLEGMVPQLQFVRKVEGGHRHLVNARGVILGHIGSLSDRIVLFEAQSTEARFESIKTFIAEILAEDIGKLQRRHTRVILGRTGSDRRISSNTTPSPSGSGSEGSSDSGYASYGGARQAKKLTRRRR